MNKKQKNKKNILQNNRNKILNRYYSSRIKSLSKLLNLNFNHLRINDIDSCRIKILDKILNISKKYYSILDKAVKKRVIHIKNASRKKSKCAKNIQPLIIMTYLNI